ncbi:hypothetical protein AKJ09_03183 [Labilithrix luteola]|uniref:Uncharacterized protein n=1 Tax=Labilithrix luteola TaxID=1391654 RepID=A0A0K1PTQ9_9BACT|nr:hypothetical protein AKJ09_03183 [Labilithrix luteola]
MTSAGDGGALADAAPLVLVPPEDPEDGDDDEKDPGTGHAPTQAKFEKVGTPPLALTRICDLTPLGDALYAGHANQPLGTDGATITRYRPDAARPFGIAFDWNRPGEPTKGGGGGQGFLRVHAIGGRLFVPDADPPYGGLGLVDHGTEGYVFVSDAKGTFAPPRSPNFRPPATPDLTNWSEGRAGAGVLPRAYHVIDVIRYRGALFASTGSVPPKEQAWRGPSPGALHRANADGSRWTYEVDYPFPWKNGVWRLTFMVRFKGRLYAGLQDYDGRDPNDYVYFAPSSPEATVLTHDDVHPVRITRTGAAGTLRFWVDRKAHPHRLYWLAWARDGLNLRVTTDGDHWAQIALPDDAGRPTDVTRFRDAVVVLTENGLYRLGGRSIDGPAGLSPEEIASNVADADAVRIAGLEGLVTTKQKKSPFEVGDFFCTAPVGRLSECSLRGWSARRHALPPHRLTAITAPRRPPSAGRSCGG